MIDDKKFIPSSEVSANNSVRSFDNDAKNLAISFKFNRGRRNSNKTAKTTNESAARIIHDYQDVIIEATTDSEEPA